MKRTFLVIVLAAALLLAGCSEEVKNHSPVLRGNPGSYEEPVATYEWMAGESPVPERRIGLYRAGVNDECCTVGSNGFYYIDQPRTNSTYVMYVDNGSNMVIKLCGRADCTHDNNDCNAYVRNGMMISYYGGYLYVVSGDASIDGFCNLFRIKPDGTDRMVALDIQAFAKEQGGDFGQCDLITEGYCVFSIHRWETVYENGVEVEMTSVRTAYYLYKLDSSMEEPRKLENSGFLYQCGDVLLSYSNDTKQGGEYGSYWDWDPETDSERYLTDHPGVPGWFGPEQAIYFRDGAVRRLTYSTRTEEAIIATDLEGKYYAFAFPDCIVLASREKNPPDNLLHVYNWNFELVDTVTIPNPTNESPNRLLIGETAERLILTDKAGGSPQYYINKSELGTGDVIVHAFIMP